MNRSIIHFRKQVDLYQQFRQCPGESKFPSSGLEVENITTTFEGGKKVYPYHYYHEESREYTTKVRMYSITSFSRFLPYTMCYTVSSFPSRIIRSMIRFTTPKYLLPLSRHISLLECHSTSTRITPGYTRWSGRGFSDHHFIMDHGNDSNEVRVYQETPLVQTCNQNRINWFLF